VDYKLKKKSLNVQESELKGSGIPEGDIDGRVQGTHK
jgi:hypothetical protein